MNELQTIQNICEPLLENLGQEYRTKYNSEIKDLKKWNLFLQTNKAAEILALKDKRLDTNKSGSVILFLLKASMLDPVKEQIKTEIKKFGKADPPDIDTDLHPSIRDDIKQFLVDKFGKEHVCSVGTVGTYKTKNVILDVARALGLDVKEANEVTKGLDIEVGDGDDEKKLDKASFEEICEYQPELAAYFELHPDVLHHAQILRNQAKNVGTHAGGVIVSNVNVLDSIPVFKDKEDRVVSCWAESGDFQELSSQGLVKMDLLGLRHLQILTDAIENVKQNKGKIITRDQIPIDDKESIRLGTRGELLGIFQFENPYTKKISDKVGVDSLADIAAITSLIRPGPKDVGLDLEYAERKNGKHYDKNHVLDKVLGNTYGVLTYQEQVIFLAVAVAGFTPLEGNALRKAIGKKKIDLMESMKTKFVSKALENSKTTGLSETQITEIWSFISSMAGYAFNKCLSPFTMVEKEDGEHVFIRSLKRGDKIRAYEENGLACTRSKDKFVSVLSVMDSGMKELWRVDLYSGKDEDQKFITCSMEHKILCRKPGTKPELKPLKEILEDGYLVCCCDNTDRKVLKTQNLGFQKSMDVEIDSQEHVFVANGIYVSNSHAVAYSAISSAELWLRKNYFCEYMTALIQSEDPAKEKFGATIFDKYIKFSIENGLIVHKPDINESRVGFRLIGQDVYFGLGHVKNVSSASEAIVRNQPYANFEDFYSRCTTPFGTDGRMRRLNSRVVESLIYAGTFDCWGTREEIMKKFFILSDQIESNKLPRSCLCKDYVSFYDDEIEIKDQELEIVEAQYVGKFKTVKPKKDDECLFEPMIDLQYDNGIRFIDFPNMTPKFIAGMEEEILGVSLSGNLAVKYRQYTKNHDVNSLVSVRLETEKVRVKIMAKIVQIKDLNFKNGNNGLRVYVTDGMRDFNFLVFSSAIYSFKDFYQEGDVAIIPLKNSGAGCDDPTFRFYDDNTQGVIIERNGVIIC